MLQHVKFSTGKGGSKLPVGEIILCPHQPGNLKISKGACGKRHLHSQKSIFFERLLGNNPFVEGFFLCRKCSIGKRVLRDERLRQQPNRGDRGIEKIRRPEGRPGDESTD